MAAQLVPIEPAMNALTRNTDLPSLSSDVMGEL
jgi:hypothetical protein